MSAFIVTARRTSAQLLVLRRPRNATTRAATISSRTCCCCCTKTTSATITKHRKCPVSSSTTTPGWLLPFTTPTRIRLFSTNSTTNSPSSPLDGVVSADILDDSDSSLQQLDNNYSAEVEEDEDTITRYFADLENLHHKTLNRLTQQGFTSMTDIQAMTWDAVLEGKDVVGRSRTGSGKAGNNNNILL
jgi:hypothetical protein